MDDEDDTEPSGGLGQLRDQARNPLPPSPPIPE
jgi:hypothetical protein